MKLNEKISNLLKRIWNGIQKAWDRLDDEVRDLVPVAIEVTNAVKEIVKKDSITGNMIDWLCFTIPGEFDSMAVAAVRKYLPDVLVKLVLIDEISKYKTDEEKITAIIERVRLFSDEAKEMFWDGLAKELVIVMSDGKIDRAETLYITKYIFDSQYKK